MAGIRRSAAMAAGLAVALLTSVTVEAGAAQAAASTRPTAHYSVSKAGTVRGPSHEAPGRVAIRITGATSQSFQLVRSKHGAGKARLLADAAELNGAGSPKRLEDDFVLLGGAPVGHTLYVTLTRGRYYAIDTDAAKPATTDVQRIIVSGRTRNAHVSASAGTIKAVKDTSWSSKPYSIRHKGVLAFVNASKEWHFVVLVRLKKGKGLADIKKALNGSEKESAVTYSGGRNEFDSGVLSPGTKMATTISLNRGSYALLCFWPDRDTGMPHALMGMYRVIKVK